MKTRILDLVGVGSTGHFTVQGSDLPLGIRRGVPLRDVADFHW